VTDPDELVSAKNLKGQQLTPGGKRWFPRRTLNWLRKRRQGVNEKSIRTKREPLRLRALREARKDLYVRERGGNNRGPEVDKIILENDGVLGEPWCGDAVARWYRKAGSKSVQRAWAATRSLGRLAGMSVLPDQRVGRPGDIVVFNFAGGHLDSDHTGLLIRYCNETGRSRRAHTATHVKTIDGNSNVGGGQGVGYQTRQISLVNRVVRVTR